HVTGALPKDYVAIQLRLPDKDGEILSPRKLRAGWQRDLELTRSIGDRWIDKESSLALIVPSAILPESKNILLNPRHPRATAIKNVSQDPFTFDPRLRRTHGS
ncbi:MAG: RES family NAD+ phosphorylase, partial [Pyrinomonadaceae bacterium]